MQAMFVKFFTSAPSAPSIRPKFVPRERIKCPSSPPESSLCQHALSKSSAGRTYEVLSVPCVLSDLSVLTFPADASKRRQIMNLTFLGTRGEIEARTPEHGMHTALMVSYRRARVMITTPSSPTLAQRSSEAIR
jgi:hypothetical protein